MLGIFMKRLYNTLWHHFSGNPCKSSTTALLKWMELDCYKNSVNQEAGHIKFEYWLVSSDFNRSLVFTFQWDSALSHSEYISIILRRSYHIYDHVCNLMQPYEYNIFPFYFLTWNVFHYCMSLFTVLLTLTVGFFLL